MNELDVKRVLQKAIDTYGVEAQLDMCIEEMSELTKAICKYKRKGLGWTDPHAKVILDLAEETADVTIMLLQLNMMLEEFDFENKVNEIAEHKVERLAERLGMENEKVTTCDKKEYWG